MAIPESELLRPAPPDLPTRSHEPNDALEIRVHGIGDQHYWSALGSAPLLNRSRSSDAPDTAEPPIIPKHRVNLLVWSRLSRRRDKLYWFLALPFTLVNVAGYMAPNHQSPVANMAGQCLLAAATVTMGFVLTVSAHVWMTALLETILRNFESAAGSVLAAWSAFMIPGAIILSIIAVRTYRQFRSKTGMSAIFMATAALNGMAVLATTITLNSTPPAQCIADYRVTWAIENIHLVPFRKESRTVGDVATVRRTDRGEHRKHDCLQPSSTYGEENVYWEVLNTTALVSMAVAMVCGIALAIATLVTLAYGGAGANYAGAAFALSAAPALLHGFASSLRQGTTSMLFYIGSFITTVQNEVGLRWWDRYLMPFDDTTPSQIGASFGDDLPLFASVAVALFCTSFYMVNALGGAGVWPFGSGRSGKLRYKHRLIESLGTKSLPIAIIISYVLWWCAVDRMVTWLDSPHPILNAIDRLLVQVSGACAIAYLLTYGRIRWIQGAVSSILDVVAFWPVEWHPLAGLSHRAPLIAALENEMEIARAEAMRKVVLVGHSQGSVVVAWFLAYHPPAMLDTFLITCGSPFESLYLRFFPRHITPVVATLKGRWLNMWRETDPISSSIDGVDNESLDDPSRPEIDPEPKGHSDYWTDPTQMKRTSEHIQVKS